MVRAFLGEMGGRAAGFRPAVTGGVGLLSPGSDWLTDCPDFGRTALRSPMDALTSMRTHRFNAFVFSSLDTSTVQKFAFYGRDDKY
jgi:hypothetical protein